MDSAEQVVRRYFRRLLIDRDLTVCDELLSPDYVDHDAPPDTPPGPAATRTYIAQFLADHPDLDFTIEELISQASTVAIRAVWTGTHRHSHQELRQHGIVFIHLDETGRLRERWSAYVGLS